MHRLSETLNRKGVTYKYLPHTPTETAIGEAIALGVPARQVLKAVLIDSDGRHAMAVVPATRRVDVHLVREALHDPHAHLATEAEIRRDLPQDELPALPPIPSVSAMRVLVDPEVMEMPEVVCADGAEGSIGIRTEELFGGESVTVTPIALDGSGATDLEVPGRRTRARLGGRS